MIKIYCPRCKELVVQMTANFANIINEQYSNCGFRVTRANAVSEIL